MVPGHVNPQNLNRFAYVRNNPLRYTDPTGHMVASDLAGTGEGGSCDKKCLERLKEERKQKKKKDDGGGAIIPVVPPGLCSGPACPIVETVIPPPYPNTLTYHPWDGNIIYDLPMYDNSYYPPKFIGQQTLYYTHDDFHFSLRNLLVPSDAITGVSAIQTAGDALLKVGSKNLGDLSKLILGPVCPECITVLSVVAGIDSVNSAITIDGHLERQIYYYTYQSPFQTPFDPKRIR